MAECMLPAQLHQEWADLRNKAVKKLHQGICSTDASDAELHQWDELLLRFRKLREGLTAATDAHGFRCEVYELSAVVCAAAKNMAELLKCLQQLVNSIYPQQQAAAANTAAAAVWQGLQNTQPDRQQNLRQVQQQMQQMHLQQQPPSLSSCSGHLVSGDGVVYKTHLMPPTCSPSSSTPEYEHTQREGASQKRQMEVSAALLLYFVCIPRKPVVQEVVKQLRMAAKTLLPTSHHTTSSNGSLQANSRQQLHHCSVTASKSNSSSTDNSAGHLLQQHEPQVLLSQPDYQLAMQAAVALLNCNWVQFIHCYEQQPPLLVRVVMECGLQRLRVEAMHTIAAAYRMLSVSVLYRWMGLVVGQQQGLQQTKQLQKQQQHGEDNHDGDGWHVELQLIGNRNMHALVRVLKSAADGGSKGARVAVGQCAAATAGLPDTLQFRG